MGKTNDLKPGVYENQMTGNYCEYYGNEDPVYDLDAGEEQPFDFFVACGYKFVRELD